MSKFYKNIIKEWPEILPYLEKMEECPQSNIHHREGNVLIHTQMVLDEVEKISENFSEKDLRILNYSALLHDIAKPVVLSFEDGEAKSHNHSRTGAKMAYEILESTNLPIDERVEITNLILYHGKPYWITEKPHQEQEYELIKMSMDCRLDLLYHLATCDFKRLGLILLDGFVKTTLKSFLFLYNKLMASINSS